MKSILLIVSLLMLTTLLKQEEDKSNMNSLKDMKRSSSISFTTQSR